MQHDHPHDDMTEAALSQALGEEPGSQELRGMAQVLAGRMQRFKDEFDAESEPARREKLKKEILKMREQILVLAEEADITQFVEDAVRVGVEMRRSESY